MPSCVIGRSGPPLGIRAADILAQGLPGLFGFNQNLMARLLPVDEGFTQIDDPLCLQHAAMTFATVSRPDLLVGRLFQRR